MNNQECEIRPQIININRNEPLIYLYSVRISRLCVPDVIKSINVKVFNLVSRTKETRHTEWHETCKCKCRLEASVCNISKGGIMINADVNV